ncbi:MAG: acyl-phosphate glycerol 3-phosphate acyltransferase [Gammaproteobacteria bacterium]|nr:MAG: acyl-phosphate glycerol 3-phosphate acyltransferase [Gammaproteobacteria bacterium]
MEVDTSTQMAAFDQKKVEQLPVNAETLIDVLAWHVQQHPDRLHVRFLGDADEVQSLTYEQLWQGATKLAAGLQQQGVVPGETVALMLPTGQDYFFSFFGILLAGAIPVPIYPPVRRSQLEDHLQRHSGILNNCVASVLISMPETKMVAQLLKSHVSSLREVATLAELNAHSAQFVAPAISASDIAFLQYTSGSTGNPKGVVLSHANLLANIRVMGETIKAESSDVFVSWLPLYHDMGLIGAWLGSLYFAIGLVVMSPLSFLMRPQRWLTAIHQYRGTLSASPNFGYELCLKRLDESDLENLDLSSWRCAFNGAEQVSPQTIETFTTRLHACGFRAETMMPVYGLAESSVGLAFPTLHREPRIDCVQRKIFSESSQAIVAEAADENALCFVSSGQPLAGHEIRIVDSDGRELPERQEGYLQFRGPSATSGYFRNPEETRKLFQGDWLASGDLAYIAEGDVFITGRSKDVIIRAGRNIYPHEVEEAVGNVPGVRKGCVAAFGTTDRHTGSEQLVVLAETRETDSTVIHQLQKQIDVIASDILGLPPDRVILAPPHTVLKTSSGKIRRSACKELYEQGELERKSKAFWWQLTRMALHALVPETRRLRQKLAATLYAGYAWVVFLLLSVITWILVMSSPVLRWRWRIIHRSCRLLAWLSGTRIDVKGLDNLPPENQTSVYVANHVSYLDSIALLAAMPRGFSFVAKAELRNNPIARLFLNRLQAEYVERFDKEQGLLDAQRISSVMQRQQSLFFFPEGTFSRAPGLRPFYMGAFVTAAQAKIPLIPMAIRGTRSILRSGSWFPRHGRVILNIGDPINTQELAEATQNDNWKTALVLRDKSRQYILNHCGEPDLSA